MIPEKTSAARNFITNFWQPWNAPKGERTAPVIGFIAATVFFLPLFLPAVGIAALAKWAIKPAKDSSSKLQQQAAEVKQVARRTLSDGLPEGVFGKAGWAELGVEVGTVPLPSEELLELLDKPCSIANDGSKMIDTHLIFWVPEELNGKPLTVPELLAIPSKKEGKLWHQVVEGELYNNPDVNKPIKRGYWAALYKKPVAPHIGPSGRKKYITNEYPGYDLPYAREVLAGCYLQYGASGDKKVRMLASESDLKFSQCKEKIDGWPVLIGQFTPKGLYAYCDGAAFRAGGIGVCPVRRFF